MNSSRGTRRIFKYFLIIIAIVCSIAILLNAYMLRLGVPLDSSLMFWLPVLVLGFLMFYSAFTFDSKYPLILIMVFAFTLHLLQFVRQPPDMIWNADSIFVYKVVENILKAGGHTFGFGTGMASSYTYYPLFYIFLSSLSSITSLSSIIVVKYSMAILNLITLLGLYALLSLLKLDTKSKNLILCIFNLNPMFHFFNSYAVAESFAIIFYPITLLYVLKQNNSKSSEKNLIIAPFFLLVITLSHHFTSYMTALALTAVPILLYIIFKKTLVKIEISILSLILPLTWLVFVAYSLFTTHLVTLSRLLSSLTEIHFGVGYSAEPFGTSFTHYPSAFSLQITQLRNLLLVVVTFLGFFYYIRSKDRSYNFFGILLLISSAVTFISLFFVNWAQVGSFPRTRLLEFAFFPIAIFFALGIMKFLHNFGTRTRHLTQKKSITMMILLALTIVFVPSTIFNAFSRHNYDVTYSPNLSDEVQVAPEAQYYSGKWVFNYANTSENDVYAGSISAYKYIIGYGQQEKWAIEIFNSTSIREGMNQTWFSYRLYYIVNRWNLQLSDSSGRKMDENTINFLNENFCRIYDNGVVELYRQPTYPII